MTRHNAHTVGLAAVSVGLALTVFALFVTRGQVAGADRRIAMVTMQTQRLAAGAGVIAEETQQLVNAGRHQRLVTTAAICKQTNELTHKLKVLIVNSVRGSRPFNRVFRRLRLPSYRVRLRAAKREAASLDLVDCKPFTANEG